MKEITFTADEALIEQARLAAQQDNKTLDQAFQEWLAEYVRRANRAGMKWEDEVVEEVRKARDAYAARFNYDVAAMCKDLEAKEQTRRSKIAEPEPKDARDARDGRIIDANAKRLNREARAVLGYQELP